MTGQDAPFGGKACPSMHMRVVLLDEAAERHWLDQSPSGEWIRCSGGDWRAADEWLARTLASPLTACRCMEWAAVRLRIDAATPVSPFLRERFARRLLTGTSARSGLAARLCIGLLIYSNFQ